MDPLSIALLVLAAFVAAVFDSIVGGGGVISLPALLAAGVPPHVALGTNKLAATGASFMATARYAHAGVVVVRLALILIPFAVAASMIGAYVALETDPRFLKLYVLVVMGGMTLYVVFRPHFGKANHFARATTATVALGAALAALAGFYDGFLGPGTGSFLLFGLIGIYRFDFLRAAGLGRVLNFASNAGALALFGLLGFVQYEVGLPMMGAMLAGGWVGSHLGLRYGARWIKPLFVAITGLLMVRLLLTL